MIVQTDNSLDLGPAYTIPLTKGKIALVSPHRYIEIAQHKWCAKRSRSNYYAMRKVTTNGKANYVSMHRLIANSGPDELCHHKNNRSLDNRDRNLENMSNFDHTKLYSWR